jgi:hypothetical protein
MFAPPQHQFNVSSQLPSSEDMYLATDTSSSFYSSSSSFYSSFSDFVSSSPSGSRLPANADRFLYSSLSAHSPLRTPLPRRMWTPKSPLPPSSPPLASSPASLPNQVSDDDDDCVVISKADFDRTEPQIGHTTLPFHDFGRVTHIYHFTPPPPLLLMQLIIIYPQMSRTWYMILNRHLPLRTLSRMLQPSSPFRRKSARSAPASIATSASVVASSTPRSSGRCAHMVRSKMSTVAKLERCSR